MRVENNLVMVIMGLLAVAVLLLVLYAMYPMLVGWLATATRWCCHHPARRRDRESLEAVRVTQTQGSRGSSTRWTVPNSAISIKLGSGSQMSTSVKRGPSQRIPNSRGVVWNARVFEGRPTVVTMGAQDPLTDLDTWRYKTTQLEAHWHVPSGLSSSGASIELESAVPSSEEALAEVHPASPVPPVSEAPAAPEPTIIAKAVKSKELAKSSLGSDETSDSSSSEEVQDLRKTVCPSVPQNALLRYVWGAKPLVTSTAVAGPSGLARPSHERQPQRVNVYAAGPSPIAGPSRMAPPSSSRPQSPIAMSPMESLSEPQNK